MFCFWIGVEDPLQNELVHLKEFILQVSLNILLLSLSVLMMNSNGRVGGHKLYSTSEGGHGRKKNENWCVSSSEWLIFNYFFFKI